MTPERRAEAREQLERMCAEQGLPLVVDDDATIDRVAEIIRSATADKRRAS